MKQQQLHYFLSNFKNLGLLMIGLLLVTIFAAGCKPKSAAEPAGAGGYFQTPFQDESQYVVEAIVSDLAEQMFYAATHRLPDPQNFSVIATEQPDSPMDVPVYEVQINLGSKQATLICNVTINGPIWSPAVYQGVAAQLARAVGLGAGHADEREDTTLLAKLADGTPETIERENQRLSAALESDFNNAEKHEQAAMLLGAFLLRDHSGNFFEIRAPLSRLAAHLTMAHFLRGTGGDGINGQMAEAMMLTLVGDEAAALERLTAVGTNNAAVAPMVRALWTRNTGDYRLLDGQDGLSRVESVAWFSARADYVSTPLAWPKLSDDQKQTIDFVRTANQEDYSVEMGHALLAVSVPLELREIASVYSLSHPGKLTRDGLGPALNELPEHCFLRSGGEVHVRIIGWGQWANFLQRHLCQAIQENFYFMKSKWGVPDDAKQFADKYGQVFDGLRLYPFVRRFTCTDVESYHQAVDESFKVTVATPQLVPAECWNYLCYKVSFAPPYNPNPNPHINEWHRHNPPPGTLYDLHPRLNHPSLISRADAVARFEQFHDMAPYDCRVINYLLDHKFNGKPSYEQATNLFQTVLPYSLYAMRYVAWTVYDQPQQYQKLMLPAAALNPVCYYDLGDYEIDRQEEDQAAQYIDQACAADPDSVQVANHAIWRVRYYLKKGQTDKARQIADDAGEVYSSRGLQAKAIFLEQTTNYDGAFEWFAKVEERYDDSKPLLDFCERYKNLTGDTRFEPEVKKRLQKLFPNGIEKVAVADFHGAPADGVSIRQQNELLSVAGLRTGDVIVALNGTRTHTFVQYMFVRDSLAGSELDLIVWQGSAYHEIKANPPNHRFGVDFGDYRPQ